LDGLGAGAGASLPRILAVGVDDLCGHAVGASKERAERFSFAMAVVITPAAIGREALRLLQATHDAAADGARRSICMGR
jgi:undecaprenyl-diphosphatase